MTGTDSDPSPPDRRRLRLLYARGKRARWWPSIAAAPRLAAESVDLYGHGRSLPPIGRLFAAVRRFRPQLVLAEYSGLRHLPLLPVCSACDLPLVVGVKGDPWREAEDRQRGRRRRDRVAGRLQLWASSKVLRAADLRLPLTRALERSLRSRLGTGAACRVVAIPFREPEPAPAEPATVAPCLLTVTNFRFRRKVEPLIRVAPRLAPVLDEIGLDWWILGDGAHLEALRRRLAGCGTRIRCGGFRDPAPYYRAARLFVYFSGLDGLPNAVLEAALHRLPIVVDRGSAAAELIADGETGAIVDLDDAAAAAALRRLAADAGERNRLGRNAEAWVRNGFAPEKVASDLEAALFDLLCWRR